MSAQDSKNKKAFASEPFSILGSSKAPQGNRPVQSGDGWFGRKLIVFYGFPETAKCKSP